MNQIDDLLEMGLTLSQIEEVVLWHDARVQEKKAEWGGMIITRLLSYLLTDRHRDNTLRIRAIGLAFGWGLGGLTGHATAEAASIAECCSPMAISKAAKEAREALGSI
jgi:hypothetical protein